MVSVKRQMVVNDTAFDVDVGLDDTLLRVIREKIGLTGTKEACGRGECGACTVLVDGVARLSCMTLCALVTGKVTTIEGVARERPDICAAFADHGGFQCGFCTSGQIVSVAALLQESLPGDPAAAEHVVRDRLSGNICRCTGYGGIVASVLALAGGDR
ncbi:2Fe-2S iron-sulfur cluster-binding protein [Roseiarcaceae bacterium H3SJ34-1]|uniref:(2Fe-2S)-binding protein n=1 Tax=Terripilifer ovatus TaxID=3032367 RepID=UPI003AB961E3|nr:2Fe-2S iron-sulfur cluster-binding protein [Roseiarcaceae bacterium H3SJ34-1]